MHACNSRADSVVNGCFADDHLRVKTLKDVYALGDCATIEGYDLPATGTYDALWLPSR